MIYDEDGTLTGNNVPTWITPYYPHFDQAIADGKCERKQTKYDDSVVCTIPLRSVKFSNFETKENFTGQKMKVFNLNDASKTYNITDAESPDFSHFKQYLIKHSSEDGINSYVAILPTDYSFNVHWNTGIDWSHLLIYPSYESQPEDKSIVLRIPYFSEKEIFDVNRFVAENPMKPSPK